ncbi:unnamed protein product, partial [Sphagnum balticum]
MVDAVTLGALRRLKFPKVQNIVMASSGSNAGVPNPSFFYESAVDNIAAHAGGGQALATPLNGEVNRIITVATSGDSVLLPPATVDQGVVNQAGLTLLVINHGANPVQVFGSGTDTINDVAAATGVSQMQSSMTFYTCTSTGKWYTQGLGEGYSGSYATFSTKDNIVAHAGGGQGSAVLLPAMTNRIITVASSGDSVILPASVSEVCTDTNGGGVWRYDDVAKRYIRTETDGTIS